MKTYDSIAVLRGLAPALSTFLTLGAISACGSNDSGATVTNVTSGTSGGSGGGGGTNGWTAPASDGIVRLWVVLRDDRRGVSWGSYELEVVP